MEKMNLEEMKVLILKYVIKEYMEDEDEEITYDTPLISSGYVDSFSMVSLLVFLENKFEVKIPPVKQHRKLSIVLIRLLLLLINTFDI